MRQTLTLLIFTVAVMESYATVTFLNVRDTFHMVKVITKGGKIIHGELQYVTDSTVHIQPGSNREVRKGFLYEPVSIPYSDIVSIRYKEFNWIGALLSLGGMTVIYLMITGVIPVFNNGLGDLNFLIWLSPLLFGYSLFRMFKRKRYVINGDKKRFDKFKLWHEKRNRSEKKWMEDSR
ncbi:hypothetical protein WG954_05980 [Lacibacter sp. H375]|uniref:hypothetical protein n=1 Tax=Lacibacter sp. H375 TaxID=3133424 RepID=UPI0030C35B07